MPGQEILATYIDGVFRVLDPDAVNLSDGQEVVIAIKPLDRATYILELAKQVYAGLSEEEIAEIEKEFRRRPLFSNEEREEQESQEQTA